MLTCGGRSNQGNVTVDEKRTNHHVSVMSGHTENKAQINNRTLENELRNTQLTIFESTFLGLVAAPRPASSAHSMVQGWLYPWHWMGTSVVTSDNKWWYCEAVTKAAKRTHIEDETQFYSYQRFPWSDIGESNCFYPGLSDILLILPKYSSDGGWSMSNSIFLVRRSSSSSGWAIGALPWGPEKKHSGYSQSCPR